MKTITAKTVINDDRTLTVQLPAEMQTGEYEYVLVLKSSVPEPKLTAEEEQKRLNKVFDDWLKEGEDLPISPTPVTSEYQQDLVEKYRKQGLEL